MEERYSDDFYQIIYSNDEKEIFEQCVRSYQKENQLNFLKYLRNELSNSNLNDLFKEMMEGTPNLTEEKMEALDKKFDRLEKIKSSILKSIEIFQSEEDNSLIKKTTTAIQSPYNVEEQSLILNSLYQRLNNKFLYTSPDNFSALFQSTYFTPIHWLGTDAELKALTELLARRLNFNFGKNANIAITERFFKHEGESYNLDSFRKATGSPKYKRILDNDPPHELYQIVEETRVLIKNK